MSGKNDGKFLSEVLGELSHPLAPSEIEHNGSSPATNTHNEPMGDESEANGTGQGSEPLHGRTVKPSKKNKTTTTNDYSMLRPAKAKKEQVLTTKFCQFLFDAESDIEVAKTTSEAYDEYVPDNRTDSDQPTKENKLSIEEVAFEDMSWGAALIIIATGILLPTFDAYSDAFLTARLFMGNYYQNEHCKKRNYLVPSHPKFGTVILVPLLLTWILVVYRWFKDERGLIQKLKTLPFVILQVYPQWRALRVLIAAKWKKQRGWQRIKEEWEWIGHIEPFSEAMPQVHILLLIGVISKNYDNCTAPVSISVWRIDPLFITTFSTSVATVAFGVAKFVKAGPAGIVRGDKCLMGFGTLSFILVFLNIAATFIGRGIVLAMYFDLVREESSIYILPIFLCFVPQLFHAFGTLIRTLGINKAIRTFIAHPAFVLTPVFSFWTYGPTMSGVYNKKSFPTKVIAHIVSGLFWPKNATNISFNFKLTWINSFVTIAGTFGVVVIYKFVISKNITYVYAADSWRGNQGFMHFFFTWSLPIFSFAIICLILVQHLAKCSCCCCKCFTETCLPMTVKTESLVSSARDNLPEGTFNRGRRSSRRTSVVIV